MRLLKTVNTYPLFMPSACLFIEKNLKSQQYFYNSNKCRILSVAFDNLRHLYVISESMVGDELKLRRLFSAVSVTGVSLRDGRSSYSHFIANLAIVGWRLAVVAYVLLVVL